MQKKITANETLLSVSGLNQSFAEAVQQQLAVNPRADLKKLFHQYDVFRGDISAQVNPETGIPRVVPPPVPVQPAFNFSFGQGNVSPTPLSAAAPEFKPVSSEPFTFSFGTTPKAEPLQHSFGLPAKVEQPQHSFGLEIKPAEQPHKASEQSQFSFEIPAKVGQPQFNFGATSTPIAAAAPFAFSFGSSAVAVEDNEEDEGIPEGEEESFQRSRSSELVRKGEGEEEEESLVEERSKLFQHDKSRGWIDLGIVIFKVNKSTKEDGKARMLVRSESTGKVLLNAWINDGTLVDWASPKKEVMLTCMNQALQPAQLLRYLVRTKETTQAEAI